MFGNSGLASQLAARQSNPVDVTTNPPATFPPAMLPGSILPTGPAMPVMGTGAGLSSPPMPNTGAAPIPAIPPTNPPNLGPMMPQFGFGAPRGVPSKFSGTQPSTGRVTAGGAPPGQANGAFLSSLLGNRSGSLT